MHTTLQLLVQCSAIYQTILYDIVQRNAIHSTIYRTPSLSPACTTLQSAMQTAEKSQPNVTSVTEHFLKQEDTFETTLWGKAKQILRPTPS